MENNANIIALAKNGNKDALEQIYTENANKVYFLCLKILKNSDDASDITQDTFIRAFSNLEQIKNPDSLTSWLLSIATSLCKNFLVKNKKYILALDNEDRTAQQIQNIEDSDDNVLPERYVDNAETRRLVMEIIDNLPDGQRIAIILFYYNGMSIKEISDILECTPEAVKSRLYYARKTIKEEVLKLEKKGTKLYGVPIIPILGSILQYESVNTVVPTNAMPITASAAHASQASTNIQAATATAKMTAIGGKSMSSMTKIIIAALAAAVVAGGAVTAIVISNNNNNSMQTQGIIKNTDESSYIEDENSQDSEIYQPSESSLQEESSKASSDVNSEVPQKSEFEQIAENMTAHYISSKVLSAKELDIKNDYGPDKYTVLTFMLTLPEGSKSVNDSLGSTEYPIVCDKDGKQLRSSLSSFNMNDGSSVYIAVVEGEQTVEGMNIKLYASFQEKTSDIKEFDRSEAELKFATGKIKSGDFVKINNIPYVYVGLKSTTDGVETGTEGKNIHYKYYHWFASLTSEPTDNLTSDLIKIDDSAAASLKKCEYPISSSLNVNDNETLSVLSGGYHKKLYEGVRAEAALLLPSDAERERIREYENNYLKPYIEALQIAYHDPNSDYSFSLNFNGKNTDY